MKKKILSMLLVLCMVLSLVPAAMLTVFADDAADAEALPSSTLTPEAVTLPEDGGKVTLPDGWSFVAHGAQEHPDTSAPHQGYATTYVLDTYVTGGIYCALNGTENGTGVDFAASWDPNVNGIDATRLPVICFNGTEAAQIDMGINACVVYSGGYAYEAPYTGSITIALDNVATGGGTTGVGWGGTGDTLVALFVGGEMVWPAEGSYDDRATWYNLNGNEGQNKTDLVENGVAVENVPVEAGQSVEFLVFHSWWDNPVKADMTVTYTGADLPPKSVFHRDMVTADENYVVTLPEGWEIIAYGSSDYTNQLVLNTICSGASAQVGPNEYGESWIFSIDLGWGSSPNVPWFNQTDSDWCWGAWMGLGASAEYNVGYSYEAPATGYVNINIDEIVDLDTWSANEWDNPMKYIAIFVNGEMVWPTANGSYDDASEWFALNVDADGNGWADYVNANGDERKDDHTLGSVTIDLAAINESIPKGIFVCPGDKIELLAKSNNRTDAVYVGTTISYAELVEEVAATASVTLGEKFAVEFEIQADPNATETGLYIKNKKVDSLVLADLAVADLSETIIYAPYQVINGVEIRAENKSITVLEILEQYTAENGFDEKTVALAQATLHYAGAAEAYLLEFDLDDELRAIVDAMAAPEEKKAKITDEIEETATFTRANLYLNDAITLKVFFTVDNATDLKATVEGIGEVAVTIEEKGGNTYAAVVELPMAAYGSELKVTVYDGETRISETLTYSVETYAARMYDADATNIDQLSLNDLLKTIVNLGKAAAAYNA